MSTADKLIFLSSGPSSNPMDMYATTSKISFASGLAASSSPVQRPPTSGNRGGFVSQGELHVAASPPRSPSASSSGEVMPMRGLTGYSANRSPYVQSAPASEMQRPSTSHRFFDDKHAQMLEISQQLRPSSPTKVESSGFAANRKGIDTSPFKQRPQESPSLDPSTNYNSFHGMQSSIRASGIPASPPQSALGKSATAFSKSAGASSIVFSPAEELVEDPMRSPTSYQAGFPQRPIFHGQQGPVDPLSEEKRHLSRSTGFAANRNCGPQRESFLPPNSPLDSSSTSRLFASSVLAASSSIPASVLSSSGPVAQSAYARGRNVVLGEDGNKFDSQEAQSQRTADMHPSVKARMEKLYSGNYSGPSYDHKRRN